MSVRKLFQHLEQMDLLQLAAGDRLETRTDMLPWHPCRKYEDVSESFRTER